MYDPATGAFTSRDSWTLQASSSANVNRLGHGNANPVKYSDPTGHYATAPLPIGPIAPPIVPGGGTSVGGPFPGVEFSGPSTVDVVQGGIEFVTGYGGGGSGFSGLMASINRQFNPTISMSAPQPAPFNPAQYNYCDSCAPVALNNYNWCDSCDVKADPKPRVRPELKPKMKPQTRPQTKPGSAGGGGGGLRAPGPDLVRNPPAMPGTGPSSYTTVGHVFIDTTAIHVTESIFDVRPPWQPDDDPSAVEALMPATEVVGREWEAGEDEPCAYNEYQAGTLLVSVDECAGSRSLGRATDLVGIDGSHIVPGLPTRQTTTALAEIGPAGNPGAMPTVKHHVFNKFRGSSPGSQHYRDFFAMHGIKVDDWTLAIPKPVHTEWVHRAGNNWTTTWKQWIDANPNATTPEVWQQAGRMVDDYGLAQYMPFVRYR
jgi:hypothetical protein